MPPGPQPNPLTSPPTSQRPVRFLVLASFCFCLFVLFYNLGRVALFEPDEGRNAEIAREILVTKDWVTPHTNFVPALDKPIFSYWLTAFSYKLFGISEWSARLPSVLAGLGSLVLIYLFAQSLFGDWEALWSGLVLVTSAEFFLLSRIVILDMALCFFITVSLCSFYWGLHAQAKTKRRVFCLLMCSAMAGATLVKGPIGSILPAMVIFVYILMARKWRLVREMTADIVLGSLLFLLIVAPWYARVEMKNPGYLRYFLWEEHVLRYLTPHFERSEPWYYFFAVLAVGFLPWTPLIFIAIRDLWNRSADDEHRFLLIWTILPFVFFSLSNAKMPHYILPIFPPLSVLTGETVARMLKDPSRRRIYLLVLPWLAGISPIAFFALGLVWPSLLPSAIQKLIPQMSQLLFLSGVMCLLSSMAFVIAIWMGRLKRESGFYLCYFLSLILIFVFFGRIENTDSSTRSAKELARIAAPLITPQDQVVLFDNYFSSLPFYLQVNRPIWVVSSGRKDSIMGSFYIAEKWPRPAAGYGKVLFTFDEFRERWKTSRQRFLVFVWQDDLVHLERLGGPAPVKLLKVGEKVLVANP